LSEIILFKFLLEILTIQPEAILLKFGNLFFYNIWFDGDEVIFDGCLDILDALLEQVSILKDFRPCNVVHKANFHEDLVCFERFGVFRHGLAALAMGCFSRDDRLKVAEI
jgi:hypothetical protein